MIQAKTLDKYYFLWAPPPLSPTPFYGLSFFCFIFIIIFLLVFFTPIFSCVYFSFFSFFFSFVFNILIGTF